jgi:hypothetical protein
MEPICCSYYTLIRFVSFGFIIYPRHSFCDVNGVLSLLLCCPFLSHQKRHSHREESQLHSFLLSIPIKRIKLLRTLSVEAAGSSEPLAPIHQSTQHRTPAECKCNVPYYKSLESQDISKC